MPSIWLFGLLIIVIILQLILFGTMLWQRKDGLTPLIGRRFQELAEAMDRLEREMREESQRNRKEWAENSMLGRRETQEQLAKWMSSLNQVAQRQSVTLRDQSTQTLNMVTNSLQDMRQTMETKLDEMRQMVGEKLHATLEQRLGDSFRIVSERLEQVHQGLGEMHALAGGVSDLKRMLSHVKVRGIWGEVQLQQLLDQVFTQEQYQVNVAVRPHSSERVDFAIRLPGKGHADAPVWLPIDAKFPLEDYQRLLEAE